MSTAVAYANLQAPRLAHTELLRRHPQHRPHSPPLAPAPPSLLFPT